MVTDRLLSGPLRLADPEAFRELAERTEQHVTVISKTTVPARSQTSDLFNYSLDFSGLLHLIG